MTTTSDLLAALRSSWRPFYLRPGTLVGAYRVEEAIGRGGGQMAYLAEGPDGHRVVLKMSLCPKGEKGSRGSRMHERFYRQVTYFLQLRGVPGVAGVEGYGMYPDQSES